MKKNRKRVYAFGLAVLTALVVLLAFGCSRSSYQKKSKLLREQVISTNLIAELGEAPAGKPGFVLFLSASDGTQRAQVFTGKGATLEAAWRDADAKTKAFVKESGIEPIWLKADVVFTQETVTSKELDKRIRRSRSEFFRYGIAFDEDYNTALLEAEMNGSKIYEYDDGGIDKKYLNKYLKRANREQVDELPQSYTIFQCKGWMCDEEDNVYPLIDSGLRYGRRNVELLDKAYVEQLLDHAGSFLVDQVRPDGSFVYGIYPRFDNDIENYNIMRHTGTLWSLICHYRMQPSPKLKAIIDSAFDYTLTQIIYDADGNAYLYEAKSDEFKLGGNGIAILAMTEYMDTFDSDKYVDICRSLGGGILTLLDQQTGEFWHVLNGDFTRKEAFRTVYYDGEATFGLCRLYSLTGEQQWLDAAVSAVNHFIAADYTQYRDHWVAYSMNEITKSIPDNPDFYAFALRNAQVNLETIRNKDRTNPTNLELLMSTFELYDRMQQLGIPADGLDIEEFLNTIYTRIDRQLDGYFFPEYAMYMKNPKRILYTFMERSDGFRIRIDDVQHNIGGYYLYYKNYDKLVQYGMLDVISQ